MGVVVASCWGFMEEIILAQFTSRVCVEGHDIGYDLHGFSFLLVIFLDVQFHLHWV